MLRAASLLSHAALYPPCHPECNKGTHEVGRYAAMLRCSFAMVAQDKAQHAKYRGRSRTKRKNHPQLIS